MDERDDDDTADNAAAKAWWDALPEDVKRRQLELIGQIPFTGRPLSELGLEGAVIVHPDGRREPFEGFAMRHEHESLTAALRASLPEGASLLNAAGDPVDLVGVRVLRWPRSRMTELRVCLCECGAEMPLVRHEGQPIADQNKLTFRCGTCAKIVIVYEDLNADHTAKQVGRL
jgi:hypothetical protein